MIRISYESGIDTVELWLQPQQIKGLKHVTRKDNNNSYYQFLFESNWLSIDKEQFDSLLIFFEAKRREEQINSILND